MRVMSLVDISNNYPALAGLVAQGMQAYRCHAPWQLWQDQALAKDTVSSGRTSRPDQDPPVTV